MIKEKITKFLFRLAYILFALFIAIVLWLYVEITRNEMISRVIPVDEIVRKNQELLGSRGLLVSSVLTDNMTLTFEGSRSDINSLLADSVNVEVDLENIRSAGTVALDYTVILPDSVNENAVRIMGSSDSQIYFLIDRILSLEFPIEVNYTGGTASEEFIADIPVFDPRTVTVSGPEEIVSRIAHIYVPIAAEKLSTTYTSDLPIILIDDFGEQLNDDLLEAESVIISNELINVTVPIRQRKTVPLLVELIHGITTSETNTAWYADPSEIIVSGDPDVMRDLNSILIGAIDMTKFNMTTTTVFPIIVPNYLIKESGETEAAVTVDIIGGIEVQVRVVGNLQAVNVPAGYNAEIQTQSLVVWVRGTPDDLADIRPENIRIVADLTDLNTGTTRVPARPTIIGTETQVDIIGEYALVVTLTEDSGLLP